MSHHLLRCKILIHKFAEQMKYLSLSAEYIKLLKYELVKK